MIHLFLLALQPVVVGADGKETVLLEREQIDDDLKLLGALGAVGVQRASCQTQGTLLLQA
jgi:hypothetical protein